MPDQLSVVGTAHLPLCALIEPFPQPSMPNPLASGNLRYHGQWAKRDRVS